jgi:DNA primase
MDMQDVAHAAMQQCARILHSPTGERARAWLEKRGIREHDMHTWRLGFSTGIKVGPLSIEPGIVIPCYERGDLWYLKVRRRDNQPKYRKVAGLQAPGLFGSYTALNARVVWIVEGEFDAMLLARYAWQLPVGIITTGGASDVLDVATWGDALLCAERIIAAYDMDEAGERAYSKLLATVAPERITRATLPHGKDITDFWQAGGDLPALLSYYGGTLQ